MAKSVFISRPTWIPEEFETSLRGFLELLESTYHLVPRTIGITDYGEKSPLDEVIRVLKECSGAIVVGVPQIWLEKGRVKAMAVQSVELPTEWNHIEAALAYLLDRPLLVIRHKTIARGIFDHGAMNKFLYEVDLQDHGWPLHKSIQGALSTWHAHVLETDPVSKYPEKIMTMRHAGDIDLEGQLKKEGYRLQWVRKDDLTHALDVKNYERIVHIDGDGKAWLLAGTDVIPVKKKEPA